MRPSSKQIGNNLDFISLYPSTPNDKLCELFNCSRPTIVRAARINKLKKDPTYLRQIQKERSVGRKLSSESKEKIAIKSRGRKLSQETKDKIIATKRERGTLPSGKNHYRWKGGRTWERFKNPEYIKWRNDVLERDNYICQDCKRQCNKREKGLAAHHIKEYAKYPELRHEINNGKT